MTTTNINYRGGRKIELTGDLMTFSYSDSKYIKDYVVKYLDGKWDANAKGWRVNVDKVNTILATPGGMISKA